LGDRLLGERGARVGASIRDAVRYSDSAKPSTSHKQSGKLTEALFDCGDELEVTDGMLGVGTVPPIHPRQFRATVES
jgi:hypothetical protein